MIGIGWYKKTRYDNKVLNIWKNSKKIHFSVSQQLQVCRDDNRFFYEYSWVKLKAYRRYFLKLWTMSEIAVKIL